jgi:hypothetical protein
LVWLPIQFVLQRDRFYGSGLVNYERYQNKKAFKEGASPESFSAFSVCLRKLVPSQAFF